MSESGTSTEEQREGNWMVSSAILESLQKLPEKLSKQESEKVYNSIIKSFLNYYLKHFYNAISNFISLAQRAGMEDLPVLTGLSF